MDRVHKITEAQSIWALWTWKRYMTRLKEKQWPALRMECTVINLINSIYVNLLNGKAIKGDS